MFLVEGSIEWNSWTNPVVKGRTIHPTLLNSARYSVVARWNVLFRHVLPVVVIQLIVRRAVVLYHVCQVCSLDLPLLYIHYNPFTLKNDEFAIFLLQPHQKHHTHSMKNLTFQSLLSWKMIILPIPTTSLSTFLFKRLRECTFQTNGSEKVNAMHILIFTYHFMFPMLRSLKPVWKTVELLFMQK